MMRISYRKSQSHFSTFSTAYREIVDRHTAHAHYTAHAH